MKSKALKYLLLGTTVSFATSVALAQDQESEGERLEDGRPADSVGLEQFVVTAVAGGDTTKFESSVSVSDLTLDEIQNFAPRSTTEIFRNIPGIRSESSGGEGNANIVVRGLPLAAGGSRFVQLQEDGLPILAFGDITFGTADQWLRADTTISRVEAVRGGSASTFASNAPGAVINLISKTGEQQGGSIGITRGLDFDTTRVDFEYGSPLRDDLYFHVGGFYRVGEGVREIGFNGEEGGQVKANITKEFETGFVRLYFKHLNDRTFPSFPQPFVIEGGNAEPIPGFDARDQALVSNNLLSIPRLNVGGAPSRTDLTDGIRAVATSIGGEFDFDLPDNWSIRNKIRFNQNDGGFLGVFPTAVVEAETFAETLPGGTTLQFQGGARDGEIITDPAGLNGNGLIATQLVFDVNLNDLSHFVNDFSATKTFESAYGRVDVTFGYYKSIQQIETDWFFTNFGQEVLGDDAAVIGILDDAGNELTAGGFFNLGSVFNPLFDLEFDRDVIYGSVAWTFNRLTFDGSVRYETVDAFGETNLGAPAGSTAGGFVAVDTDVNNDGVVTPVVEEGVLTVDTANLFGIDYEVNYIAYSVGANYLVTDDLAVFARYSRGGVVNGDRLILGAAAATFTADGDLTDESAGFDIARQAEIGIKYQSPDDFFIPGAFSLFLTGFYSDVDISTFDITEVAAGALDQGFESFGIEWESNYRIGNFNLAGSFTWTDAEIVSDLTEDPLTGALVESGLVGNTPQRQADFIYQITPTYTFEVPIRWDIGANLVGTTSSPAQDDNVIVQPGFVQLNLFLNAELTDGLIFSLNVNNANNAFGITEINDFAVPDNGILRGRPIPGRTISASLRYEF